MGSCAIPTSPFQSGEQKTGVATARGMGGVGGIFCLRGAAEGAALVRFGEKKAENTKTAWQTQQLI